MARRHILLADDEEMVRTILRLMLSKCGYQITEAADGEDAVSRYCQSPGSYDLVLLDKHMPRLGGDEALERMRQVDPQLKAILLSGGVQEPTPEQSGNYHTTRHLQKPFENQELIGMVREMLPPTETPPWP